MNLLFDELFIFSPSEKVAKHVKFRSGINVVTSSQIDGTDRGKSVILRSLYHTLGANACFDTQWKSTSKIYILKFHVDKQSYFLYRSDTLYKLFDYTKRLIFSVTHSQELAAELENIFGFAIKLPNRQDNRFEIAPPVYNYLPYFVDQDHYDGSKFSSFENLSQYANYKESVLYTHFGVYNDEYFSLIKQKEQIAVQQKETLSRLQVLKAMQDDIKGKLETGAYSGSLEALKHELKQHQREYASIMERLNSSKMRLIGLRDTAYDLECTLRDFELTRKTNETEIKTIQQHRCPECNSIITDTIKLKGKRFNLEADLFIVHTEIETSLREISESILAEEEKYNKLLNEVHAFEEKMQINSTEINDILRFKGFCEIRDGILTEQEHLQNELDESRQRLKDIDKKLKGYQARKKAANDFYTTSLITDRAYFNIEEINPDKLKDVTSQFAGTGSNKNIATIIWHMAIIRVRNKTNSNLIRLPLVLDSPNNVETDDEKEKKLMQYILDQSSLVPQLIIASIGFDGEDYQSTQPVNLILLTNEKRHLLNESDYQMYCALLYELCDAK